MFALYLKISALLIRKYKILFSFNFLFCETHNVMVHFFFNKSWFDDHMLLSCMYRYVSNLLYLIQICQNILSYTSRIYYMNIKILKFLSHHDNLTHKWNLTKSLKIQIIRYMKTYIHW